MSAETRSKTTKLHKRVKLAIGRSKNNEDNVETLDSKKKDVRGNRKARTRKLNKDDISYADGKLYKREDSEKRSMKSKTNYQRVQTGREKVNDRNVGLKSASSNWKQKRVYAEHDNNENNKFRNNVRTPNTKDYVKEGRNKLKDDFVKDDRTTKGRDDSEQSSRMGRRPYENKSLERKGGTSLRGRPITAYKAKNVEQEGGGIGMVKIGVKGKSDSNKQMQWNQNTSEARFLEKSAKKKFPDKRSFADDTEVTVDRPKRKKRVIRIDPHDITNKRLDDTIAAIDTSEEKKEDLEKNKNVEMSMNAQFRAIQPSSSILSFVEENLLGRRREIELRRAGYNTELPVPLDNIPFSTNSERERIEETVFRNKLTFFAAAKVSSSVPPPDLPEIAFAGRSNVGKSSLLNALTRQWGVVRTSDKPGLTQTINFFNLESKLCLVDLPGYGFAYAKEEVKEAWEELVKEYVSTRVGLKRVCLLIDTKWGMKPRDHELIDLMERSHTKYQIVLTKTDTVFPTDVARRAMQIEESFKAKKSAVQPVMMVSSKSGAGIRSLRTVLCKIARFVKP